MSGSKRWKLIAIPGIAMIVLAGALPAGASPADDKRAEAARIAKKRESLIQRAEQLNEQSKATKLDLDRTTAEVAVSAAAVAQTSAEVSSLQNDLVGVTIKSYMYGEQGSFAELLVSVDGSGSSNAAAREGYASVLVGSATDKVDELRAARQDTERISRDLTSKQTRLTTLSTKLNTERSAVTKTQAELVVLATKVNGELVQLVADETRRREEAEAAKARAEADRQRKELARRAEQQRQALVAKRAADQAAQDAAARAAAERNAPSPQRPFAPAPRAATPLPPVNYVPRPPAPNPGAAIAIAEALRQLGKPYVFGTNGPDTFDCSGLTQWSWAKAGVRMDHFTGSQANAFPRVSPDQLQPGDLVFFNVDLGHMGMYIGNDQIVQAPRTGDVVKITSLNRGNVVVAVRPG
jgi:peptidoglycan DL-endopeptidase CwlO